MIEPCTDRRELTRSTTRSGDRVPRSLILSKLRVIANKLDREQLAFDCDVEHKTNTHFASLVAFYTDSVHSGHRARIPCHSGKRSSFCRSSLPLPFPRPPLRSTWLPSLHRSYTVSYPVLQHTPFAISARKIQQKHSRSVDVLVAERR